MRTLHVGLMAITAFAALPLHSVWSQAARQPQRDPPTKKSSPPSKATVAAKADKREFSTFDALGTLDFTLPSFLTAKSQIEEIVAIPGSFKFWRIESNGNVAAVISVRIPPGRQTPDSPLDPKVATAAAQMQHGTALRRVRVIGGPARVIEAVMLNGMDTDNFPIELAFDPSKEIKTAVVKQSFQMSGRLLECAILLRRQPGETVEKLDTRASDYCTKFRESVRVGPPPQDDDRLPPDAAAAAAALERGDGPGAAEAGEREFSTFDALGTLDFTLPSFLTTKSQTHEVVPIPGVAKYWRFERNGDVAAVTSARPSAHWLKGDRSAGMTRIQKEHGKAKVRVRDIGGPARPVIETVLINCKDTEHFPMDLAFDTSMEIKRVGIRQSFDQSGRALECAILLRRQPGETVGKLETRARDYCTSFRESVRVEPPKWDDNRPPQAPKGYSWVHEPTSKAYFLRPDGWHFNVRKEGETIACFITKQPIDPKAKPGTLQFETGVTINIIRESQKQFGGAPPSQSAGDFVDAIRQSQRYEVEETFRNSFGPFEMWGARYREKGGNANPLRLHTNAFANDTTATMYLIIFESPVKSWDSEWKVAEPIIKKLIFHPNY